MATITVAGYLLRHPVPGNMYAFLHYVVGLHRLGHRVIYLEESGWPYSCYDPVHNVRSDDPTAGIQLTRSLAAEVGADEVPLLYVDRETRETWGTGEITLDDALQCDLLLNVGGVCWLPEFADVAMSALVDMDPVFTQAGVFALEGRNEYDAYFTYGSAIDAPGCSVPRDGLSWRPLVPPVVTDLWQLGAPRAEDPFSTVANWAAYEPVVVNGVEYAQKDVEFRRLADVPRRAETAASLVAIRIPGPIAAEFAAGGWAIAPDLVGADVARYRDFIKRSAGEFSAAKHAYVATRSGWLSDRTVCYLASGRPALVQDTGQDAAVPLGRGLLTFDSPDAAVQGLRELRINYSEHSAAAVELARDVFAHDVVLPGLLATVGLS
jgi:hypothetical protein